MILIMSPGLTVYDFPLILTDQELELLKVSVKNLSARADTDTALSLQVLILHIWALASAWTPQEKIDQEAVFLPYQKILLLAEIIAL